MNTLKVRIMLVVVVVLLLIQFVRPGKNESADTKYNMVSKYTIPETVSSILNKACADCHSNTTVYPWYAEIQPVGWWLNNHIKEGKGELNFSAFTMLPIAVQNHKFEVIMETVEEGEMPLPSYTWLGMHPAANLTEQEKDVIINWAESQMDLLKKQT